MLIHRGEKIFEKLKERGMSITKFSEQLDIARSTAYNWFERADLPIEYVIQCSKVLDYDFLEDFKAGLQVKQSTVAEPEPAYGSWKEKYYDLLEKNWGLQEKFNKLMEKKLKDFVAELG